LEKAFVSLRLILGRYYFEAFQKSSQKWHITEKWLVDVED